MPVIPTIDPSQVEVASNPVPIHTDKDAGMQGEATASFGAALAQYGAGLDKIAQHTAAESQKIQLIDYQAQFKAQVLQHSAAQAAAKPIPGDSTGFKAAQNYMDNAGKTRDAMMNSMDPAIQGAFKADADRYIADEAPSVLATEVKKRAGDLKPEIGSAISSLGALANSDPYQIQYSMTKAEAMINQSNDIPEANKPTQIRNAKASILRDTIYGFAQRQQWDQGQKLLNMTARDSQGNVLDSNGVRIQNPDGSPNAKSTGIPSTPFGDALDAKERENLSQFLSSNQSTTLSRQATAQNVAEKNEEHAHKKNEQNLLDTYQAALATAGNDASKRDPILQQIEKDVQLNKIDAQKAQNLANPSIFSKDADDRYAVQTMADIQLGNTDPDKAVEQIKEDNYRHISPSGAKQLLTQIQSFRSFESRSGIVPSQAVANGKDEVTKATLALTAGMSPVDKASVQSNMENAYNQYHMTLAKDPTMDTSKAVQAALHATFGSDVSDLPPNTTPEKIEEMRKETAAKNIAKIKANQMSETEQREALQHDRELLYAKTVMLLERQSAKHQTNFNQNSGSNVPAR